MAKVVAEFYGGPSDGEIQELPHLAYSWRIPIAPPVSAVLCEFVSESEPLRDRPGTRTVVVEYELVRDPAMGRPSINDQGRYRYEFKGYL